MTLKEWAAKRFASFVHRKNQKWIERPVEAQDRVLKMLVQKAARTAFGKDHDFASIQTIADFQARVPVVDYEGIRSYIDRVVEGEPDVLWPGKPLYFAKTSGTTSGTKYIPLSKESMPGHIRAARDMLLAYIHRSGDASLVNGKLMFLQGSPELTEKNGIQVGRLSGISAHYVPAYLQNNRLPSWETNCMDDWEAKVDRICDETIGQDLRALGGIPPWVQMYFERLLEKSGKTSIQELFPQFKLYIAGGVAFEPYRARFEQLFGGPLTRIDPYPASEGFIAYQDRYDQPGLLLLVDNGIFYEFIPADRYFEPNPPRLTLAEVEVGVNYALIMHTNAGLWGYSIGDTIAFVELNPYRIHVTGRIKHFISAFGEHVIGSEVEAALEAAVAAEPCVVREFTVAPQVAPAEGGLPYHEWSIAFDREPSDLQRFSLSLDAALCTKNTYYKDLVSGGILRPAVVRPVPADAFQAYMKSMGKLGGQNKLPRLSNDRKIADWLTENGF
jgi:hypothetical protein